MKPNFALTLSLDGICLLHRATPGWNLVDEVALDTDDLTGALSALRDRALTIEPGALGCKLVLPNDQIRFLHFDAEGLDADEIGDAVRRQLDGATPYTLDELAYDWSISAGQVYVAAVAHETKAEAEAFAVQHGFEPLCFVAAPESRDFIGEPWFGQTKLAEAVLHKDTHLERDTAAIRVTGAVTDPTTETAPADAGASDAQSEVQDQTDEHASAGTNSETETETPLAFATIRASREHAEVAPEPPISGELSDSDAPAQAARVEHSETVETPSDTGVAQTVRQETDNAVPEEPELVSDTPAPVTEAAPEPVSEDSEDDLPFVTRRSAAPPVPRAADRSKRTSPVATRSSRVASRQTPVENEKQRMTIFGARGKPEVGGKPRSLGTILTAVLLVFLVGVATWASIFRVSEPAGQEVDVRQSLSDKDEPSQAQLDAPVGEPPRQETDNSSASPEEDTMDPERLAALPDSDVIPDLEAEPDGVSEPAPVAGPLSEEDARARYAVTGIWLRAPDEPASPPSQSLENLYQTSIDPAILSQDAVALPDSSAFAPDLQPTPMFDPVPPGTDFSFDDRGLVRATPEGALTPDGVAVFSGRPALLPPQRPDETLEPEPDETAGLSEQDGAVPDLTDEQRARLAEVRPRPRPDDLTEQSERAALGSGGRTQAELATLRPNLRPPSPQDLATDEGATEQAVTSSFLPKARPDDFDTIVASAIEAEEERARQEAEREATQKAERQAAQQAAQRQVQQQQAAAAQSASLAQPVVEPQETRQVAAAAVPRNQRVTPSAPTATSVARAATDKNVLKLRRINLIGVYGGPSDRRALVRLANGRYKKVKVGDRLDGGRVTAIGASELRYSKSGRDVALKMPQG